MTVAAFQPTKIYVKVGDDYDYLRLERDWAMLKDLGKVQLLEAIAGSKMFGVNLTGVDLGGCDVVVVSAPTVPDVITEATQASKVGTLTTLSDATTAGKCSGDLLFIHVRLPGAEPFGLYGECATGVRLHAAAHLWRRSGIAVPAWQHVHCALRSHHLPTPSRRISPPSLQSSATPARPPSLRLQPCTRSGRMSPHA